MSPRVRSQTDRIKDALDGKKPLGAKSKRKLGKEEGDPELCPFVSS